MSTSRAKKDRMKRVRQGMLSPEMLRGCWQGINPASKKTPTLLEKQAKLQSKHKRDLVSYSDDSFSVFEPSKEYLSLKKI